MTTLSLAPDPTYGRVRVVVQDAQGGQLLRDGQPVRGAEALTGDHLVDDYEAPFGVPVTYTLEDAPEQTTTLAVDTAWLSSATDPGLPVTVRDQDPRTYSAPGRTYRPIGSRWPVAVYTERSHHAGTLQLLADPADSNLLRDLVADGSPLLLRTPPGCALDTMWMFTGQVERLRLASPTHDVWTWSLPYERVAGPSGSVTIDPSNAWVAVTATHPTWTDLVAGHADWFDVALTPHPHP